MKQCIFALTTAHLVKKNISYFSTMPLGSIWTLIQSNVLLGIHTVYKNIDFFQNAMFCVRVRARARACVCIHKDRERKVPVDLSEIGYRLQTGSHSEWTVFTITTEVLDVTHQGMWKRSCMPLYGTFPLPTQCTTAAHANWLFAHPWQIHVTVDAMVLRKITS
jgi:hypothetical protein